MHRELTKNCEASLPKYISDFIYLKDMYIFKYIYIYIYIFKGIENYV